MNIYVCYVCLYYKCLCMFISCHIALWILPLSKLLIDILLYIFPIDYIACQINKAIIIIVIIDVYLLIYTFIHSFIYFVPSMWWPSDQSVRWHQITWLPRQLPTKPWLLLDNRCWSSADHYLCFWNTQSWAPSWLQLWLSWSRSTVDLSMHSFNAIFCL